MAARARLRPASGRELGAVYRTLLRAQGHAAWWPAETPFEVCLGAILTQNTSWTNVEKALSNLRSHGLLSFAALARLKTPRLAPLIRSSGYFNVKARRLKSFLGFLRREYGGRVEPMASEGPRSLRTKLLSVPGIGRETADSIVLYAAGLPLFVVDAYTRRIFSRLGYLHGDESYDAIQDFFMERLPKEAALYNDYHAQVVLLGKNTCRKRPRCAACSLERCCEKRGVAMVSSAHARQADEGGAGARGRSPRRTAAR